MHSRKFHKLHTGVKPVKVGECVKASQVGIETQMFTTA